MNWWEVSPTMEVNPPQDITQPTSNTPMAHGCAAMMRRSHLLARAMFSTIRLIFFCTSEYVVVIALFRAKYSINRESLSLGK